MDGSRLYELRLSVGYGVERRKEVKDKNVEKEFFAFSLSFSLLGVSSVQDIDALCGHVGDGREKAGWIWGHVGGVAFERRHGNDTQSGVAVLLRRV